MKNKDLIILMICVIGTFIMGLGLGILAAKEEYKNRYLQLPKKECYTNKEIKQLIK